MLTTSGQFTHYPVARGRRGSMMERSADQEQFYADAFDCSPIGQAVLALDGRFQVANAALHTLLGHPAGALLQLRISDVLEPEAADAFPGLIGRLVAGATPTRSEQPYRTSSGTTVRTAQTVSLTSGPTGSRVLLHLEDLTALHGQELQLAKERDRVREAQLVGRLGSWEIDVATQAVTWSDGLFELRGVDRATFDGDFAAATSMVHPEDRFRVRSAIEEATRTGEQKLIRYRAYRMDDHDERWFDARFKGLYDGGELVTIAGTVVDVTEDVLAEERIRTAYAFQQAILTASPDITILYDLSAARTTWSSRPVREVLGFPADPDAVDAWPAELVHGADRSTMQEALRAATHADDDDVVSVTFRLQDATGSLRWFSSRTTPLSRSDDGTVAQLVAVLRDITEAKAAEERLQFSALHDDLTGLANRALLIDRIQGSLLRSARDDREVSVLFCDLDGFKRVNDTAGHAAGDAVLIETARRLESVLRDGDTVARVGGDEFVMVVEPWNRPDTGAHPPGGTLSSDRDLGPQIADRVAAALRRPFEHNGIEHVISASIGITYGPTVLSAIPTDATADAVLQDADAAMYTAKRRGKDRFEIFEHGMRTDLVERGRVERVLRRALRSGQAWSHDPVPSTARLRPDRIWAVYQPIFAAPTGALTGFEALARLADSNGLPIPPDVFVPIAEETGLVRALGAFMLDQAIGQLAYWRSRWRELSGVTMAVNVSALQVGQASLAQDVRRALAAHGLRPPDLTLEVTETALLEAGRSSITTLQDLRDTGMGVAIDDFGVGYASLRYLATLPVSGVKIDRSFTARLTDEQVSRKIIRAIAALTADLDLDCTVEGVETPAQQAALPEGVRLQGNLFGKPQEAAVIDVPALIRGVAAIPATSN